MVTRTKREPLTFEVYKVTNLVNGKAYIGKTTVSHKARFYGHKTSRDTGYPLNRAIKKYGVDNFRLEVIYIGSSEKEINMVERAMIASHNTYCPNGYNLTIGGEGASGARRTEEQRKRLSIALKGRVNTWTSKLRKGCVVSEETRKKISESWKYRTISEETREKQRIASTGRLHSEQAKLKISQSASRWQIGKIMSPSTRMKIYETRMRMEQNPETTRRKPVFCLNNGKSYNYAADAAAELGIEKSKIYAVCRGVNKSVKGYSFRYI